MSADQAREPAAAGDAADELQDHLGLVGQTLNERYRVECVLGEGGMGAVYTAHHQLIGKSVVIKVLHEEMARDPELVRRFRREARAATAIGHDHIVDVTDMGELPDGSPFIVMEKLEGVPLADALEDDGPMTVKRAVHIIDQACDGLAAAHDKGIVHRDLKPDNIFLVHKSRDRDFVKILDFGISKVRENAEAMSGKLTQTGVAMGTPMYMSPEQAQGLPTLDHRTDIYAIGVILFEMLSGTLPFNAESYPALLIKMMTEDAPRLIDLRADIPVGLSSVVERTLAKRADDRPADMRELAELLEPYRGIDGQPELKAGASAASARSASGSTVSGVRATVASTPAAIAAPGPAPGSAPGSGTVPAGSIDPARQPEPPLANGGLSAASDPGLSPDTHVSAPGPAAGPGRGLLIGAVVGLVAIGLTVGGWVAFGGRAEPAPPVVEPPAPVATEVRLRIRASPATAEITVDGQRYPNPLDAARPRSLDPVTLRVHAEGYRGVERILVLDQDRNLDLELAPLPAAPEVPAPTPTAETPEPEPESAPTAQRRGRRRASGSTANAPTAGEAASATPAAGSTGGAAAGTGGSGTTSGTGGSGTSGSGTSGSGDGIYTGRRGQIRDDF